VSFKYPDHTTSIFSHDRVVSHYSDVQKCSRAGRKTLQCSSAPCYSPSSISQHQPLHILFLFLPLLEQFQIQRQRLSHPSSPLSMISLLLVCIRMHQCRQRSSVDHQPRNKRSKLFCQPSKQPSNLNINSIHTWSEQIHFKHAYDMRTKWFIPDPVYA
jgi:hypothetical protein